jgi:hypothetical protein
VLGDSDVHQFNDDCSDITEVEVMICGAESRINALVSQLLIDQIYIRQEESFEVVWAKILDSDLLLEERGGISITKRGEP